MYREIWYNIEETLSFDELYNCMGCEERIDFVIK